MLLLASHNLFLYLISISAIDKPDVKVWYNMELLLFFIPFSILGNYNHKSVKEIEFRKIALFAISLIITVIILNNCKFLPVLPSPRTQMLFFNGISFAIIGYGLLFSDKNGNI